MKKIVVENTPLKVPKLVCAERGFDAIKEFFEEQRNRNQENMPTQSEEQKQDGGNPQLRVSKSLRDRFNLDESEEEDDRFDPLDDSRFADYKVKKQQLIPKEFAFAIIEKMKDNQGLDLYEKQNL